jgi:phospholipase/lecithinase/hemolysin
MPSRRSLRVLAALICLAFESTAARAAAPGYDAIYVFGDSYSDVGNVYLATAHTTPPSPPYFNGRFSNGPIWVEHIASAWGLPMLPSLVPGGTDYAVGGAHVTSAQVTPSGTIPSVPQQVELFLSSRPGGRADPNALYVIEGGGDDILAATGGSPEALGFQIALGISESELLLRRAGAKYFLIPDLLDVAQLPAAKANASFASAATVATNKALDSFLALEAFLEGVRINRVDVFSLFHAIKADATHFGFTDILNPCLNPAPCSDPDHTLFWDAEHPTEFAHAFFAVAVETRLGH